MLETEEVDDDYFTPVAKTSLASIFRPSISEKTENETLKYTPPIAKPTPSQEEEMKRKYENVFSCVVESYLWLDNVYTHKGKLGFAVVKLTDENQNFHTIILYDSKKATLSSATASKELEITVKGKDFISYYDRHKKYWCLYGSEDNINKIIEILKACNVIIKVLNETDNALPDQNNPVVNTKQINIESDTDSSINRKTKASILNRMANMGQSVFPPHFKSNDNQTSDSSDTNESADHIAVRHKPIKNIVKKNNAEKNALDQHHKTDAHKKAIVPHIPHSIDKNTACMFVTDQLLPIQGSSTIASTSGNDLNYFITEQRIANSELRINITRMTDKVDNILSKVNDLQINNKNEDTVNINNEILQKLLREYESKIKTYEDLLKNVDKNTNMTQTIPSTNGLFENKSELMITNELAMLKKTIADLHKNTTEKDKLISVYKDEIKSLKTSNNIQTSRQNEDLHAKLIGYENALLEKQDMLANVTDEKEELIRNYSDETEQKIKSIMNDTFRAIEMNFENNESYSGTTIKTIIATVIKKVTLESLNKS